MKRLKIPSLFREIALVRPLFIISLMILLLDLIYVNYIFVPPVPQYENEYAKITGTVREKKYDEYGKLKSFYVGCCLCYVNNVKAVDFSGVSKNNAANNPDNIMEGSHVTVYGKVKGFDGAANKGEFDVKKYYSSLKIYYSCTAETVTVDKKPLVGIKDRIKGVKSKLSDRIEQFCKFEGGTVNTLLLADKSGLSKEREELYQSAGVAHFLVISGLHISAIGNFIYMLLKRLGAKRNIACFLSLFFLVMYGILTGFTVSIIRAVVMFGIRLFADIVKRVYDMLNAVSFAMIVTILINPYSIMNSGFVYSYMTVFSIAIYITYIHPKAFLKNTIYRKLREVFRIPVVLFLFVCPITLYVSYSVSVASIIINAILAPFCAPILGLSFLAAAFSVVRIGKLATFFDFLLAVLLKGLDGICRLSTSTGIFMICGKPDFYKLIIYYLVLFFFFHKAVTILPDYFKIVFLLANIVFLCNINAPMPLLSMLSVGQGECIVIGTGTHSAAIVDCGSTSKTDIAGKIVVPFLKASGIRTISGIYCTHSDKDHMGEIGSLILECKKKNILVKRLYLPKLTKEYRDSLYLETAGIAENAESEVVYIAKGSHIYYSEGEFNVLWPKENELTGDSNEDSLVMLVNLNGLTVLLTGDATMETEQKILGSVCDVDLLKVAHHGSKYGTSDEFLDRVMPEIAIISAGKNNRYNHPNEDTLKRLLGHGTAIKCTKEYGEIDVYSKEKMKTFLNP